jgi:predicted ATPase/DNA-binding CsgD family transcriptional regulator
VLPAQPTPLVDREQELAAGLAQLRGGDVRLLTLVGPGGSGKTRLALALGEELCAEVPAGVFFVDLSHAVDPHQVPLQVAATLRLRDAPGQSAHQTIARAIGSRRALLILDNLEQVVGAGAEVARLLADTPALQVIATSRQPLRLRWEHLLPVPPLPLPAQDAQSSAAALLECPSTRLFVERARAANPNLALTDAAAHQVAEICRRLDGLPLAIEIAAARARVLGPAALLAHVAGGLDLASTGPADLPDRQRSLRSTIQWSYRLLAPDEQRAFRRLAAFRGGCEVAGAAAVLGDRVDRGRALELLTSLAEKNLLVADAGAPEPRFTMLETLREYAYERLREEDDEADALARHAAFVAALADQARQGLLGGKQSVWLDRLDREQANVRAALRWALDRADAGVGLRIAAGLWRFWELRGRLREGRETLAALLAMPGAQAEIDQRVLALYAAAHLALLEAEYDVAGALYRDCITAARHAGDRASRAAALNGLGVVATCRGAFVEACEHLGQAVALNRASDDRLALATNLNNLGRVALYQGEHAQARRFQEDSLAIRRETGDLWGQGLTLGDLAEAVLDLGDPASARRLQMESLAIWRSLGSTWGVAYVLEGLVGVELAEGRPRDAVRAAGAAAALREALGEPTAPVRKARLDAQLAAARGVLGSTAFERALAEGRALDVDQAVAQATSPPRPATAAPPEPSADDPLSPREREVARLVARGLTNRQVADELVISERTVDVHVARILAKLGFSARAQIAAWVARREPL